jgi:photosystem II stability/assembly factor-like uncharacterized protein
VLAAAVPAFAAKRRAVRATPLYPPCGMVTGTASVTFTHDFGATLAPSAESLRPISYTYGLAAMIDEPDTLMAWNGDDLLTSTDAGCSWRVVATMTGWDFPPRLTPARGGRVYAWADNRRFFVRYDSRGVKQLKQPADFIGVGVDPANGERLRAGGSDGSVWESNDAGESWEPVGSLPTGLGLYYRFAFDPNDLDHVVAGVVSSGAFVSRDGGRTWTRSNLASANVFEAVISPADGSRVWVEGIDLGEIRRHIWVSSDGGATFTAVIDEGNGVDLINGNLLAAHPTDKDVLYFEFGTYFQGYGTDLYRFDLRSRTLTINHNPHDGVNAIVFSPNDPNLIYLGIEAIN